MSQLNSQWQQKLTELTQKYQLSEHAIMVLLQALIKGNGKMAQFNHPELGGAGQWLPGGMTMISDMSNSYLKMVIDNLCGELASLIKDNYFNPVKDNELSANYGNSQQQQQSSGNINHSKTVKANPFNLSPWWPTELGTPTLSGNQNNLLYAYFANKQRLILKNQEKIWVYDTLHHQISGVSQQQGSSSQLLIFTSQAGTFAISDLPQISATHQDHDSPGPENDQQTDIIAQAEKIKEMLPHATTKIKEPLTEMVDKPQPTDIFNAIKKLAEFKEQGIISEQEFEAKKTELLKRL